MSGQPAENQPNLIQSVLSNKCPHCRKGNLFTDSNPYRLKTNIQMPERCPVCGQRFELQPGFYFGTGYVSYGLSVVLMGVGFLLWHLIFGLSVKDNSVVWCLSVNIILLIILQPVLQRLARSIWIAFFVKYEPGVRAE